MEGGAVGGRKISEIERILEYKYGVNVRLYEEGSYICDVWIHTKQQPLLGLEEEVAEYAAKKYGGKFSISILKVDISKPGKPEFSEVRYAWGTTIKANSQEELEKKILEFKQKIPELEEKFEETFWSVVEKLSEECEHSFVEEILNSYE